ncbi:MAG: FkbM family methyltransferase [Pseudanabaenaceae cyanobacterium bins.39]|nr:FkbM family methyltransferase [Pseudanabaenaceae cyanobacterium bins.39]
MAYLNRIILILTRFISAASMGVYFSGTNRFQLPKTFLIKNRQINLNAPEESGLAWDFINVLLDDEYGLRKVTPAPRTVLDIGANIGLFSMWAKRCFPSATIHAYEPNPRITPFTQKNLDQLNITLFKEAIGAENGFASIIDSSESRLGQFTTGASEGINVILLEEAINRIGGSVDLLKLDCEGAEWEIFRNSDSFKKVKSVRMEYHLTGGKTLDDVKRFINSIDFTIHHLEENSGFGIVWFSNLKA